MYISPNRNLLYVTDASYHGNPSGKLEHLSCFLPGVIALGVQSLDVDDASGLTEERKKLWGWAAEGLGRTCWLVSTASIIVVAERLMNLHRGRGH